MLFGRGSKSGAPAAQILSAMGVCVRVHSRQGSLQNLVQTPKICRPPAAGEDFYVGAVNAVFAKFTPKVVAGGYRNLAQ